MSRESYAATVMGWRMFLDALNEELAKAPDMERQVAELAAMYIRAQQLVNERNALQAAMQTATRELQAILDTGRVTATYLRKSVKYRFGRDSEQMVQFGMRPARKRSRRKKSDDPQE
jgi:hypothetical protein